MIRIKDLHPIRDERGRFTGEYMGTFVWPSILKVDGGMIGKGISAAIIIWLSITLSYL